MRAPLTFLNPPLRQRNPTIALADAQLTLLLRTHQIERWEGAGCPGPGRRPGEGEVLATRAGAAIARYSDDPPVTGDEGAIDEMCLYAGEGCAAIEDLPPVAELLDRLSG